jgi:protocatechuate 3,4-dioxygenase, beta subunit
MKNRVATPSQTEGPFYPQSFADCTDSDLTIIGQNHVSAQGQSVWIEGTLSDSKGKVISGAIIDVWQACASGRYNHPSETNPAPLDKQFQFAARLHTDSEGSYRFKTIIPGVYPATDQWQRPPHIHFRVEVEGVHLLTTQMYFKDHPLNARDEILQDTLKELGTQAYDLLMVDFSKDHHADGCAIGRFDIILSER